MPSVFRRRSDLVLLLVFCAALVTWRLHDAALLTVPVREYSDYAANAIKIDAAKHFVLLTGNYSRWDFCHPGPAFFYCYALAERIGCDLLSWFPAPGNAHAVAGLLLQTAFLAGALLAFARRIGNRWFMPLALLLGAVHYQLAFGNSWETVWPPNVLVLPFFTLLVSCSLLASGSAWAAPAVVITGGFLVHGHVAQPFFVMPLSGLAFVLFLRDRGERKKLPLALGLILLSFFLLPLILEAFRPHFGNYGKIVEHLGRSKKWHSVPDALLYGLSFLAYRNDQDSWLSPLKHPLWPMVRSMLPFLLGWAALLISGALAWKNVLRTPSSFALHPRFLRRLALMLGLSLLLFAFWTLKQDGPLFAFNSFFFHSILYALLLVVVAVPLSIRLDRLASASPVGFRIGIGVAAIAATVFAFLLWKAPPHSLPDPRDARLYREIEKTIVEADIDHRPIHLLWPHDGWPTGVALALYLDRHGIPWTVHQNFHTLCNEQVLADPEAYVARGGAVWTLFPDEAAPYGYGIRTTLASLAADGLPHPLSDQTNFVYLLDGFDADLDLGRLWSEAPQTDLAFLPVPTSGNVAFSFIATPLLGESRQKVVDQQRAVMTFDGTPVGEATLKERGVARFTIPQALWNRAGGTRPVVVRIDFPDAIAPKELHLSRHARPRAWGLESFTAASAATAP